MNASAERIRVIDSHTGGEPTRIIVSGAPIPDGTMSEKLRCWRSAHDRLRSAIINEPRGSDVLVGGLLTPAVSASATAGIVFFNNVGYLGMCGHGTIGLIATLSYLARIQPGAHWIDTPVGTVGTHLHEDGTVTIHNVPAYRSTKDCRLEVPGIGRISGDIAWGGNWFFICDDHGGVLDAAHIPDLLQRSTAIRRTLALAGITGDDGAEIDHVELCGPSPRADSRNFVLCPGGAYDRSPCGTGTSAKLACLAADGKLAPGQPWHQESIIGSVFKGSYQPGAPHILPSITGRAFITSDNTVLIDEQDPFAYGISIAGS